MGRHLQPHDQPEILVARAALGRREGGEGQHRLGRRIAVGLGPVADPVRRCHPILRRRRFRQPTRAKASRRAMCMALVPARRHLYRRRAGGLGRSTPQRSAAVCTGASHSASDSSSSSGHRDRAAGHLERGDVGADQRARDLDPVRRPARVCAAWYIRYSSMQRRAAEAVDEQERLCRALQRRGP